MMQKFSIAMNIFMYRLTGGAVGGRFPGTNLLLLTTTGRKSGKKRTTPLRFLREGNDYLIVASNWGKESLPAWFYNLQANPDVTVQDMNRTMTARARVATAEEQARFYPKFIAIDERFQGYQDGVKRTIAVIVLEPNK